ncbi:MAG: glycosyltransferase family 4 protein [Stenotrophomonas sp.]
MRIAFLCKRHYTGKDVILDRYGRLYEWPRQLTRLGHEVRAWCLDYRGHQDEIQQHEADSGSMVWASFSIGHVRITRIASYPYRLHKQLIDFKPDLVIGTSDIPHVALATWLAHQLGVPSVVDLYDNFESFGQARIPGFQTLLAYAIRNASLVVTVSQSLKEKVFADHSPARSILVIPNGINGVVFSPGPRPQARQALGLPIDAKLIGTAGGLSRMKGLDTVYTAWQQMEQRVPNLHLVLAGPVEKGFPPPAGPRVHYLGELPERQVADLFRALDVGIIPLKDSAFGRYCFPQKAYEMLACHLPVVVANTGEMASLFDPWPQVLFAPGNATELSTAILQQLNQPVMPNIPILDWVGLIKQLEPALEQATRSD